MRVWCLREGLRQQGEAAASAVALPPDGAVGGTAARGADSAAAAEECRGTAGGKGSAAASYLRAAMLHGLAHPGLSGVSTSGRHLLSMVLLQLHHLYVEFVIASMEVEATDAEKLLQARKHAKIAAEKAAESSAGGSSSSSRAQRKGLQGRPAPDLAVIDALVEAGLHDSARTTAAAVRVEPNLQLVRWPGHGLVRIREMLARRDLRGQSIWLESVRQKIAGVSVYGGDGDDPELLADMYQMMAEINMGSSGIEGYGIQGNEEWSKYDELD